MVIGVKTNAEQSDIKRYKYYSLCLIHSKGCCKLSAKLCQNLDNVVRYSLRFPSFRHKFKQLNQSDQNLVVLSC